MDVRCLQVQEILFLEGLRLRAFIAYPDLVLLPYGKLVSVTSREHLGLNIGCVVADRQLALLVSHVAVADVLSKLRQMRNATKVRRLTAVTVLDL